jgi:hypothetical protein
MTDLDGQQTGSRLIDVEAEVTAVQHDPRPKLRARNLAITLAAAYCLDLEVEAAWPRDPLEGEVDVVGHNRVEVTGLLRFSTKVL